jgi:arylsulfatase A-like enzyme
LTRVLLLGLDGFPSRAISPGLTPNLWRLGQEGGMAPDGGRSGLPSSTYPGFASLLTGVWPERHGVRATARKPGAIPGWAGELSVRVATLFDGCKAAGITSAAILGDHLLHGVLGTHVADRTWPERGLPEDSIPRDAHGYPTNGAVRPALLATAADPQFGFVFGHLNEPDTLGHDLGPDHERTRACYGETDQIAGEVIAALRPRWGDTTVMVVSDHDMEARDERPPLDLVGDPRAGRLIDDIVVDGGAAFVRVRMGADAAVVREAVLTVDGVSDCRVEGSGRLLVLAAPGRLFAWPKLPAGGHHGGPGSQRTVAIVGGGHPAVRSIAQTIDSRPPGLVDWAPTIATLLGLDMEALDGVALC